MSPRLIGINHVALEVGDIDEALAWYGRLFEVRAARPRRTRMAFIDMGDQFIALSAGRTQPPDGARHFGLVVDDKEAVRAALQRESVAVQSSGSCDFTDPWGNNSRSSTTGRSSSRRRPRSLRGWASRTSTRRPKALEELRSKGLA